MPAPYLYPAARLRLLRGLPWESALIHVLLVAPTYAPSASHRLEHAVAHELKGPGYERMPLGGKTLRLTPDGTLIAAAAPARWPSIRAGTVGAALLAFEAESLLLAYLPLPEEVPTNRGPLTIEWGEGGIFTWGLA